MLSVFVKKKRKKKNKKQVLAKQLLYLSMHDSHCKNDFFKRDRAKRAGEIEIEK